MVRKTSGCSIAEKFARLTAISPIQVVLAASIVTRGGKRTSSPPSDPYSLTRQLLPS